MYRRRGDSSCNSRRLLPPQNFVAARGILELVQGAGLKIDAAFASTFLRAYAASTREAFNRAHATEPLGLR